MKVQKSIIGVPTQENIDLNQHQMRTDQGGEIDPKRGDQDHQILEKEGGQDPNHPIDQRAEDMMTGDKGIDQGANQDQEKCSPVRSST